jgi:hypothetical protein
MFDGASPELVFPLRNTVTRALDESVDPATRAALIVLAASAILAFGINSAADRLAEAWRYEGHPRSLIVLDRKTGCYKRALPTREPSPEETVNVEKELELMRSTTYCPYGHERE